MAGPSPDAVNIERILRLARELADSDPGPAAELGAALAEAVIALSGRMNALVDLISAALDAAEISPAKGAQPPAEFVQALTTPRGGDQGVRLNISGSEWIAAISRDRPPADPGAAWAALQRVTATAEDQPDDA